MHYYTPRIECTGTIDHPVYGEVDVVATAEVTPAERQYFDALRGEGHPGCAAYADLLSVRIDCAGGAEIDPDELSDRDRERLEEAAVLAAEEE
jgi:hypothetical protein